jgi:hypothetical protein
MVEVELQIPDKVQSGVVGRVVEQVGASDDLRCYFKGTLVSYPERIHRYFEQVKQRSRLEITGWESGRRLWFKLARDEPVNGSSKIFPIERIDRKI